MTRNLLLLLLLTVLLPVFAQTNPAGRLKGRIHDENGIPVAYCNVLVFNNDKLIKNALADEKGYYRIDKIPQGEYSVKFDSWLEFNQQIQKRIIIQSRKTTTLNATLTRKKNIQITLKPVDYYSILEKRTPAANDTIFQHGMLKGKIRNKKGKGLTPCVVTVRIPFRNEITAIVNPDGTFQIDDIPSGQYFINANYSGIIPTNIKKIQINPGKATVLIIKAKKISRFGGGSIIQLNKKREIKTWSGQDIELENYEYWH